MIEFAALSMSSEYCVSSYTERRCFAKKVKNIKRLVKTRESFFFFFNPILNSACALGGSWHELLRTALSLLVSIPNIKDDFL